MYCSDHRPVVVVCFHRRWGAAVGTGQSTTTKWFPLTSAINVKNSHVHKRERMNIDKIVVVLKKMKNTNAVCCTRAVARLPSQLSSWRFVQDMKAGHSCLQPQRPNLRRQFLYRYRHEQQKAHLQSTTESRKKKSGFKILLCLALGENNLI